MRVAHYITPLVSDGIPERHVIFDTEAASASTPSGEVQTFRLAAAEFVRFPRAGEPQLVRAADYEQPAQLWADVVAFTRAKHRTIVWAHNAAYDLRIARGLRELPALGLPLRGIVLDGTSCWARFRGRDRTVLVADLTAWLPAALEMIARDLGSEQPQVEHATATIEQLRERCRADVMVTRGAVVALLELIRDAGLGPWRQTGAGQSHAAWRKRFLTHQPLVHDDESALEAERRALWTGRCEAWRWGKITELPAVEYDLQLAYCNIAAEAEVPHTLVGRTGPLSAVSIRQAMQSRAILADVEVSTDRPLVPASRGNRIHWPIGTFTTMLWDPELALLLDRGQQVKIRRAWLYDRAPSLQHFSRWLLARLDPEDPQASAVQRRALKHMSRTLVGRFGMRYRGWERFAQLPDFGLRLGELHDLTTGERIETLHVGHEFLTLAELTETEDGLPQVTGWVMAEARARLWSLVELAGETNVLYMDTDSLIVTPAGAELLDQAIAAGACWSLARKATYHRLTINGPRQLIFAKHRRVAGVPRKAVEVAPDEYDGEVWRSLRTSIDRGEAESVTIERKRFKLAAVDERRRRLADGLTAPHAVG